MELDSALKPLRVFSQLLGLNVKGWLGRVYTLAVFATITSLLQPSFVHLSHGHLEMKLGDVDSLILWTQFFANIIFAWVVLIVCVVKPRQFLIPIEEMHEVDVALRSFGVKMNERFLYRTELTQVFLTLVISNLLGAQDIYRAIRQGSFATFFHWLHYSYVHSLAIVVDCLFVDYLSVVKKRFFELNQLLKVIARRHKLTIFNTAVFLVAERDSDPRLRKQYTTIVSNFEKLRLLHHDLCGISKKVNGSFGIQQLVSTAISLVMITGQLYEAYYFINETKNPLGMVLLKFMWIALHVSRLFYISNACSETSYEANKCTSSIIHEIPVQRVSSDVSSQVRHFSLQLLHDNVNFNACGFFEIDFRLLCSIVGAVTTYLVILVQMDRRTHCLE